MPLATAARKAIKLGALPLGVGKGARTGDLVALLYHRVGSTNREIDVPENQFERQIEFLSAQGRARSLDLALSDGGVVVTFDDGYEDFYSRVLPVIERHRMPAVLYLATGLVATNGKSAGTASLSWSQLSDAVTTGLVTVGAHTHSHADLSRADERAAYAEMSKSKEMIEDRLGRSCDHFAYPWGVASPGAERAARKLFSTAALGWGTNRAGAIDPYRLSRSPVLSADGTYFFRAKVDGRLDGEALAYRALKRGPWRRT
jgi:peptidoglycan/xylan/chitin deacetylase (PgdA/CDA1 family)